MHSRSLKDLPPCVLANVLEFAGIDEFDERVPQHTDKSEVNYHHDDDNDDDDDDGVTPETTCRALLATSRYVRQETERQVHMPHLMSETLVEVKLSRSYLLAIFVCIRPWWLIHTSSGITAWLEVNALRLISAELSGSKETREPHALMNFTAIKRFGHTFVINAFTSVRQTNARIARLNAV